jgi:chemotaxis protein CheD
MQLTVGISDMKTSKNPKDVLTTHSLGSCLGLAVYDPVVRVGGLIHCMLPSVGENKKGPNKPFMYVSTGVPIMIREMYALGATKPNLIFKAAGCGQMMNVMNHFNIGARNFETLMKLLSKNGIRLAAKDVGESKPRTVHLNLATGKVTINSRNEVWEL